MERFNLSTEKFILCIYIEDTISRFISNFPSTFVTQRSAHVIINGSVKRLTSPTAEGLHSALLAVPAETAYPINHGLPPIFVEVAALQFRLPNFLSQHYC